MVSEDRPAGPAPPPPVLDDPAWFGAVMGSAATAAVAALQLGRVGFLGAFAGVISSIILGVSIIAFLALVVRNVLVRRLGRGLVANVRSPRTGPAYATIPGAVNVLAVGLLRVWPATARGSWWLLVILAGVGTILGLCLTVVFFVGAFESEQLRAEDISGIWFIPETVVLLGSYLFAELAPMGPPPLERSMTVVAVALLGVGGLLFGVTVVIVVSRLVLQSGVRRAGGAPAMWIMISPLAVTSLALQSVAGGDPMVGGSRTPAVTEVATLVAGALWGFALWWIAAATVVTRHAGRAAMTQTAADWGFVFPSAAMVLATVTLARKWQSWLVDAVGFALGILLALVWVAVLIGTVRGLRRRSDGPTNN